MGGRRKTKLERELSGRPGHRTQAELNRPELPLVEDIGYLPAHIQGIAAEEWGRVTPELVKNRMLTIVDRALLEAYCASYQRWREAESLLKNKGLMIGKRINPAFTLVHRCVDQMHGLAVKLGRSRPALPAGGEKADDDDEFFGDGKNGNEKKDGKPKI